MTITKPFYLGKYEVTQEQWEAVMGSNPSHFKGPKNPVEQVSWDDCQQFLVKLNAKSGGQGSKFVLPTEAQWEYACRAGSTGKFCFGDDEKQLGEYAWYEANSGDKTHPVGEKKPNTFGLHDMHGNVWEWCQDWYGEYGAEAVEILVVLQRARAAWFAAGAGTTAAGAASRRTASTSSPGPGAAAWACVSPEFRRTRQFKSRLASGAGAPPERNPEAEPGRSWASTGVASEPRVKVFPQRMRTGGPGIQRNEQSRVSVRHVAAVLREQRRRPPSIPKTRRKSLCLVTVTIQRPFVADPVP